MTPSLLTSIPWNRVATRLFGFCRCAAASDANARQSPAARTIDDFMRPPLRVENASGVPPTARQVLQSCRTDKLGGVEWQRCLRENRQPQTAGAVGGEQRLTS